MNLFTIVFLIFKTNKFFFVKHTRTILGNAGVYYPTDQLGFESHKSPIRSHFGQRRAYYDHHRKFIDYAYSDEVLPAKRNIFPDGKGEPEAEVYKAQMNWPVGLNGLATPTANAYSNAKSVCAVFRANLRPSTAVSRRMANWYAPITANGDSGNCFNGTNYTLSGIASGPVFGSNNAATGPVCLGSRGVFTHIHLSYTGQLQSANGSLYIYIPNTRHISSNGSTSDTTFTFNSIFGESDQIVPLTTTITNSGAYGDDKITHVISLAELATKPNGLSFTIMNELAIDEIFREPQDQVTDVLDETINSVELQNFVACLLFCDSQSGTDRIRICVSHGIENIYNPGNASISLKSSVPYKPDIHAASVRKVGNDLLRERPTVPKSSIKKVLHTHVNDMEVEALSGAAAHVQQPVQTGNYTDDEEDEFSVHASFTRLPKALKAFKDTEMTDNEFIAPIAEAQPELAAMTAPFVEPIIAAHAFYNAIRANNKFL